MVGKGARERVERANESSRRSLFYADGKSILVVNYN